MLVITTPTGQIGRPVVDHLLAEGEQLRVVVRDASRLESSVRSRVEVIEGSHDDPDVLRAATTGAEALLLVVPPAPQVADVHRHYAEFAEATATAVRDAGVQRLVAVSTLGLGYPGEAGHLSAALEAEPVLASAGADLRVLRMPFFMDNLLNQVAAIRDNGMFFMPNSADRVLLTVATADIAAAASRLLADRSWSGRADVPVIGPDRLTPDAMAQVIAEVLDRPVRYQQVDLQTYRATMQQYGMSEAWAQGLSDMAAAQNDGIYDHRGAEVQPEGLPDPTPFRTWCLDVLAPAVAA